ncbi:DoxX family protein [Nocardia vinacea]|uniref:DoxX family protein n=1 Tax=Nocardia vinacea TaxID=96468 RepID=UPI0033E6792D
MFVAYVVVTILAAAAAFGATGFDIVKADQVRETMRGYGLPQWTLNPLAILKALGGLGLLIGLAIPPLGRTAASAWSCTSSVQKSPSSEPSGTPTSRTPCHT